MAETLSALGICRALALAVLLVRGAVAGGGSLVPTSRLVDRADAVVIARVIAANRGADKLLLTLKVEKRIKGPIAAGTTIESNVPGNARSSVRKERGIFFLRALPRSQWAALPLFSGHGRMSEIRGNYFSLRDTTRVKERALASPVEQVLGLVVAEYRQGRSGPERPVDLIQEYRMTRTNSRAIRLLFADLGESADPYLRRVSFAVGLMEAEQTALLQLRSQAPAVLVSDALFAAQQLSAITEARSPARGLLADIAKPSTAVFELRLAAAAVLARIDDAECIALLAPLLDSQHLALAAIAVSAMSSFANNTPPGGHRPQPGAWKYRTDDTIRHSAGSEFQLRSDPTLLAFWKAWWANNGSEIAPPSSR